MELACSKTLAICHVWDLARCALLTPGQGKVRSRNIIHNLIINIVALHRLRSQTIKVRNRKLGGDFEPTNQYLPALFYFISDTFLILKLPSL